MRPHSSRFYGTLVNTKGRAARGLSTSYTFHTPSGSRGRIPLLKAPSHLGHYTSRVNRYQNEDRYYAGVLELPIGSSLLPRSQRKGLNQTRQVFNFAVFDGHGGDQCSHFLKDNLAKYVEQLDMSKLWEIPELYKKNIGGYWRAWHDTDHYVQRLTPYDDLQLRLPMAFLQADYEFAQEHKESGSTCTSVYIYSQDDTKPFWAENQVSNLVVAHVGDTRCIICDKFGTPYRLTTNHHPSSLVEATRLKRYTASFFTDSFGEERFGRFANTRSFGDLSSKAQGISAEPEIVECRIGDTMNSLTNRQVKDFGGKEAFLVLVSDGVSDKVTDQEMVDIVINTANKSGSGRGTPQEAAQEIVEYAEAIGGDDNATCLVVRLPGWGEWSWHDRTAMMRENKLRDALDNRRDRLR